jgi:hypothetical protein
VLILTHLPLPLLSSHSKRNLTSPWRSSRTSSQSSDKKENSRDPESWRWVNRSVAQPPTSANSSLPTTTDERRADSRPAARLVQFDSNLFFSNFLRSFLVGGRSYVFVCFPSSVRTVYLLKLRGMHE